jgi:hypothetical protein
VHLGIILVLVGAFFVCAELVKLSYYRYTNSPAVDRHT